MRSGVPIGPPAPRRLCVGMNTAVAMRQQVVRGRTPSRITSQDFATSSMVRPLLVERGMRVLSLVAVASLALAGPGCTFVGASAGAGLGYARQAPDRDVSIGKHIAAGAAIGLAVDV